MRRGSLGVWTLRTFSRTCTHDWRGWTICRRGCPPGRRTTRGFLLTVANRLVIDRERQRGVRRRHDEHVRLLQDTDNASSPSAEAIALASEDLEAVASALEAMKPEWRRAFVLNRFSHMSYREVAKAMDVSTKTVEKYIGKALLHLRTALLGD